jgi:hypothetical protein
MYAISVEGTSGMSSLWNPGCTEVIFVESWIHALQGYPPWMDCTPLCTLQRSEAVHPLRISLESSFPCERPVRSIITIRCKPYRAMAARRGKQVKTRKAELVIRASDNFGALAILTLRLFSDKRYLCLMPCFHPHSHPHPFGFSILMF